jgi:hypothetical protein
MRRSLTRDSGLELNHSNSGVRNAEVSCRDYLLTGHSPDRAKPTRMTRLGHSLHALAAAYFTQLYRQRIGSFRVDRRHAQ